MFVLLTPYYKNSLFQYKTNFYHFIENGIISFSLKRVLFRMINPTFFSKETKKKSLEKTLKLNNKSELLTHFFMIFT